MLGISTLNRRNNSLLFRVSRNFLALKSLFLSVQTLTLLFSSFFFLYGKPSKNCSHFYTTTHIFTAAKACRPSLRPSLAAVCLWLSLLSVLSSSVTENHALLGWALIWPFRNISCLCFRKLLDSFPSADKTVHWKHRLISSKALWLNLSRVLPVRFTVHPAPSISTHIINKNQWSSYTGIHTCPCNNTVFTKDDEVLPLLSYYPLPR